MDLKTYVDIILQGVLAFAEGDQIIKAVWDHGFRKPYRTR